MIQTRTLTRFPRLRAPAFFSRLADLMSTGRVARGPDEAEQLWLAMIAGSDPTTAAQVFDQMEEARR